MPACARVHPAAAPAAAPATPAAAQTTAPHAMHPATSRKLTAAALVLLLALLLLNAGTAHAATTTDLLTVWQQARQADPQLAAAQARRGVQDERAVQARAAWRPQADLQVDSSRHHGDGGGGAGAAHRQSVTLSLSQVLFDLGRLRTVDAEHTLADAQALQVQAAEQALAGHVARAYFAVLTAQAALATAQANEAALATQADQGQARFDAGLVALVDVEQSRTYHALARGSTATARQALADARAALAELTGQPPPALRPLAPEPSDAQGLASQPLQPADAQAWVDRALAHNPRLAALQRALAAGGQRVAAARAAHLPTLSAGVDSQRSRPLADGAGRVQTQLALRLTVPLLAGGTTASGVRLALHEQDALREALEAERRAVQRETQVQHQAVLTATELRASTASAAAAADRALAATRSGHTLGTRSNTDLLLALQTQAQARRAHDDARHAQVLAQLLLQQAAGSLGPDELAAANRLLQGEP